jgi:predicted acylesterase/phospholipase RssA
MTTKYININKAKDLLNGDQKADFAETRSLIEDLKAQGKFSYAAMLLHRLLAENPSDNELLLNLSLCIYKDSDLPSAIKFDKALEYLHKVNATGNDQTACSKYAQYGAIYKRSWQSEGNLQSLETSLLNYKKGYLLWKSKAETEKIPGEFIEKNDNAANDFAYNGINYAFCLDLLSMIRSNKETFEIIDNQSIMALNKEADTVRKFIIKHYLGAESNDFSEIKFEEAIQNWHPKLRSNEWIYGTLGEAFFGCENYEASQYFFLIFKEKMTKSGIVKNTEERNDWKISISAQQLYNLSTIQTNKVKSSSGQAMGFSQNQLIDKHREVLKVLIDNPSNIGDLAFTEKVGLGLSGGGFRAALYHIGVLARLAELDMLRHVEVISCVSGGSIIGAYYYLKIKNLLESVSDDEITSEHYIKIIQEIEVEFLENVQKNLRQRVLTNFFDNAKMAFSKHYSRTHRLGELYEEYFYAPLTSSKTSPVYINELKISPIEKNANGEISTIENFSIKKDNWYRKNKIPNLVLNATSLNTGHNWQFTASWMGEPPANLQPEIDMKSRLRRMYYNDAPERYQKFRLGYAVASSSCVPGLFAAFPLPDLYPNMDLKLVDGGVHDNQGITSLIEQECKFMIISDASGQLTEENSILNAGPLYTINRTNLILQERIRENEFMEVSTRFKASQLYNLKFMHLKKNLYPRPISWEGCKEPLHFLSDGMDIQDENTEIITPYKINAKVQDLISKIRTDLDAFSDQEAYALMYSGYQMTKYEFRQGKIMEADARSWRFFSVADDVGTSKPDGKFMDILRLGSSLFGKVLEINIIVKVISYLVASAIIVGFVVNFYLRNDQFTWETRAYQIGIVAFLLTLLFSKGVKKIINLTKIIESLLLFLTGFFLVGPLVNLYMWFLNKIYLNYGQAVKRWWKK